jgi:ADP-heptose:LPS heptosyltransferase
LWSTGVAPKCRNFEREGVKKILIIRIDRIGDLILSTPAIRAVRKSFPAAEIHLLISEYTRDLVIHNEHVDKVLLHEREAVHRGYDLAFALHPGMVPNRLTYQSGAQWRFGYTGKGGSFFLTHKIRDDRAKRIRHEVESALEVVAMAGCTTESRKLDISITDDGERFADAFFRKNPVREGQTVVVIHPGSRQDYIRWSREGFAEVADALMNEDINVILIGGMDERQLVEDTATLTNKSPVRATGMKLTELLSLIKRCDLFIGHSTGPMHIAAALNVPVVAIFGAVHPLDSLS